MSVLVGDRFSVFEKRCLSPCWFMFSRLVSVVIAGGSLSCRRTVSSVWCISGLLADSLSGRLGRGRLLCRGLLTTTTVRSPWVVVWLTRWLMMNVVRRVVSMFFE